MKAFSAHRSLTSEFLESRFFLAAIAFHEPTTSVITTFQRNIPAVADFDSDGKIEIVSISNGRHMEWNPVTAGFEDVAPLKRVLREDLSYRDVVVSTRAFDGDGDGDLDVYSLWGELRRGTELRLSWYENLGDRFAEPEQISSFKVLSGVYANKLGDLDGDGDLDAFNQDVWIPMVNGQFVEAQPFDFSTESVVDAFDIDGDGAEELITFFEERFDTGLAHRSRFEFKGRDVVTRESSLLFESELDLGKLGQVDDAETLRIARLGPEVSLIGIEGEVHMYASHGLESWRGEHFQIPDQRDFYDETEADFEGIHWFEYVDVDSDGDFDVIATLDLDDAIDDLKWFENVANESDLNKDGIISADDVDHFCQSVALGESTLNLNGDGQIDWQDVDLFARRIDRGSGIGDVDFNGDFDSSDLTLLFQRGRFGQSAKWSEGDFNCDGRFGTSDLVLLFQQDRYDF